MTDLMDYLTEEAKATLPLRRTTPRTPEEYRMLESGEVDSFPVPIKELLNDAVTGRPTPEESGEAYRKQMVRAGARLKLPGYKELWEEEYGKA